MSAEALLAPFTGEPMLDSSWEILQGAGNLGIQNPGQVRVKTWHHGHPGSCGILGLFWCVYVEHHGHWEQYLGTALQKNCLSAEGVLPMPLWVGTPCCIPADHHGWGSHVSSAVGSCSNTLHAHRRILTHHVWIPCCKHFPAPYEIPDLCHKHLLWVDVCL